MSQLQSAWEQLLQKFALDQIAAQDAFTALSTAYHSPGRVYHTLDHIADVLHWIEMFHNQAGDLASIQLAAWFHDCIYDPQASDNEEQSAIYAQNVLSSLAVPTVTIQAVTEMILSTKTHKVDADNLDGQILLDADLAILGAPALRYDNYAQAIRQEYGWVPEASYRMGRIQVLQSFSQRPRIYQTDLLSTMLEAQARVNIRREMLTWYTEVHPIDVASEKAQ